MATVGQQLLQPESGWKRYDQTDPMIEFSYTTTHNSSSLYNGTQSQTNISNNYYRFGFYGTKFRIIEAYSSNRNKNIQVTIDNKTIDHYDAYATSDKFQYIMYEKLDLEYGYHTVEVRKIDVDTTTYMSVDAIDIDENGSLERYDLDELLKKRIVLKNPTTNQYYSLAEKTLIQLPNTSSDIMIQYGIKAGREIRLDEAFDKIINVETNGTTTTEDVEPFSVYNYISDNPQVVFYNESTEDLTVSITTEPFSVYDHISETPEIIVYTESTNDIVVTTDTEPYDLYDELGDEVEVLYYTDDEAVTEADLVLEANWSPIDELEGDFEIVTWTDEGSDTAQRVLEMTAIPKPQFIKLADPKRVYGYLESIIIDYVSEGYRNEARYLLTDENGTKWYRWNNHSQSFITVDASTHELILQNGMTENDISNITDKQWKTWEKDFLNIGIFLKDNPRDTIVSVVDSITYKDYLPRNSTTVEKGNFYILNTTAKIDIELDGAVLKGFLSDDDLTRVQYRVSVNGENYFPADGSFTSLSDSPENIEIILKSNSIKIGEINRIKVEFQDFFGTTDYWETTFIGTYSGLMFKDVQGQFYSSEAGEVLQYLDFGVIIAGQTTLENEILLKNQYGYDVENIYLYANHDNLPQGMSIQFSESTSPFTPKSDLSLSRVLKNNEEMSFFIRLKTDLYATPDANGTFDIVVRADRVD